MNPPGPSTGPFAVTPTVAGDPERSRTSAAAASPAAGWHRLRILGIVAPVLFILAVQVARPLVAATHPGAHVALDVVTAVAVIVFGLVMFRLLDRWHGETLRTNRELAVRDAVATAVRDAGATPDTVATAAARSVRNAAGAVRVLLTVTGRGSWDAFGAVEDAGDAADIEDLLGERDGADAGRPVRAQEIPLLAASVRVGSLWVWLPTRTAHAPDADGSVRTVAAGLSPATIEAVGQQIGSALQRAVLAEELAGALRDQQTVSRVLVQITTGTPLAEALTSVVRSAAQLTGATTAGLALRADAASALHPEPRVARLCVDATKVTPCVGPASRCPHRAEPSALVTMPVRIARETIGELWVSGAPEPRHTVLHDLAELTAVTLEHARLLEDERSTAAVREREWIAREMHDSLAQVLGVLHLRLRTLEALAGSLDPADAQRELVELADIAHDAFVDVREAILGLRENAASDRSFLEALRSYLAKYERQSGIRARIDVDPGDAGESALMLTPAAEVQMLRVIQEALTNVRKHADAREATVRLSRQEGRVRVEIADDGVGFRPAEAQRFDSFGLSSMRERCELVGGEFQVTSAPGEGTRVTALLPAATAAPAATTSVAAVPRPHGVRS